MRSTGNNTTTLLAQKTFRNYNSSLLRKGRVSSVGIAIRYGLDGPGIESLWKRNFPHSSRPAVGPTQPPIQMVPSSSRG